MEFKGFAKNKLEEVRTLLQNTKNKGPEKAKRVGKRMLPVALSTVLGAGIGAGVVKNDADEATENAKIVINALSKENQELLDKLKKEKDANYIESKQFHCLGVTLEKSKSGAPVLTLKAALGKPLEATIHSIPVTLSCPFNSIEGHTNKRFNETLEENPVTKTISIGIKDTLGRPITISFTPITEELIKIDHLYPSREGGFTGYTETRELPKKQREATPPLPSEKLSPPNPPESSPKHLKPEKYEA